MNKRKLFLMSALTAALLCGCEDKNSSALPHDKTVNLEKYFDITAQKGSLEPETIISFKYLKDTDNLLIIAKQGWEHRVVNSISLFVSAFNMVRHKIDKDFTFFVETGDFAENPEYFAYSSRQADKDKTIPDFLFINWSEVGINDYDEMCRMIEEAGQKPYIYDKLFWIGNAGTHESRQDLLLKGWNNPNFEFIGMDWIAPNEGNNFTQTPTKYVSLPDHTQYKYLLDITGRGYSARLKLLLFSNRPLFYVERADEEYYMRDLKPFEHYIPVKADLSDLEEKFAWAESHPEETRQIARNALEYAKKNLTRKAATIYYSKIILDYARKYQAEEEPSRPEYFAPKKQ